MIVTTTNILDGLSPTVTTGSSGEATANLTNQDFSLNYTSLSQSTLTVSFGSIGLIDYVAVAGIILKGNGAGTSSITLSDGGLVISTVLLTRDNVVVFDFPEQTFSNLILTFTNGAGNRAPTVSYIAGGAKLIIPNNGEVSGHSREWLNRRRKTKSTLNGSSAPIGVLRKPVSPIGRLNMPNILASFSQNEWQTFLDFAIENIFFINEDSAIPESSYCCYDITTSISKAHGQTRELNNLSTAFKIYSGI